MGQLYYNEGSKNNRYLHIIASRSTGLDDSAAFPVEQDASGGNP
jgi:hypothetical protein